MAHNESAGAPGEGIPGWGIAFASIWVIDHFYRTLFRIWVLLLTHGTSSIVRVAQVD
jgi:hypothetical protein